MWDRTWPLLFGLIDQIKTKNMSGYNSTSASGGVADTEVSHFKMVIFEAFSAVRPKPHTRLTNANLKKTRRWLEKKTNLQFLAPLPHPTLKMLR